MIGAADAGAEVWTGGSGGAGPPAPQLAPDSPDRALLRTSKRATGFVRSGMRSGMSEGFSKPCRASSVLESLEALALRDKLAPTPAPVRAGAEVWSRERFATD